MISQSTTLHLGLLIQGPIERVFDYDDISDMHLKSIRCLNMPDQHLPESASNDSKGDTKPTLMDHMQGI